MEQAMTKKTNLVSLEGIIHELMQDKAVTFSKSELKPLAALTGTVSQEEREFFRKYLLHVHDESQHPQNNLYNLLKQNNGLAKAQAKEFHLHDVINVLITSQGITEELRHALINIRNTDRVIYPVNSWFNRLLSRPFWSETDLLQDEILTLTLKPVAYTFQEQELNDMNGWLDLPVLEKVEKIVGRNKAVQEKRGNHAWIVREKGYRIVYGETESRINTIDPEKEFAFPYFLNAYLSMFWQIEQKK